MRANLTSLKTQANINHMTSDSRQVQVGSLFVAYKGDATDGRAYIPQAIANGASAVMWEQEDFAWLVSLRASFMANPQSNFGWWVLLARMVKQLVVIGWRKPLQRLVVNLPWLAHWAMAC
jgi:UDP-N-acetylmuramyl pentapeptide synthase